MSGVHFLPPNVPDALGMKKASIFGKLRALWGREQSTDCSGEREGVRASSALSPSHLGTGAAEHEAVLGPGWASLPSPFTREAETCVCPAGTHRSLTRQGEELRFVKLLLWARFWNNSSKLLIVITALKKKNLPNTL